MVTNEELDAAAEMAETEEETSQVETEETTETQETAAETETEETPAAEEQPESSLLDDERVRSVLGRLPAMQSKIDSLEHMIKQGLTSKPDEEETDGFVTSENDVIAIMKRERQKEANAAKEYKDTAVNALIDVGLEHPELDDETYLKIHKDAEANWKRVTGNAKQDAEINFTKAMNRYYQGQLAESQKPKNPLDKNAEVDAEELGGPTDTTISEKPKKTPKLDSYAQDFVNRTNMKAESVQKALEGDMPAYLGGR